VVTLHDYWYPCANAQLITNYDESICAGPDAKMHNCGRCFFARAGLGDRPNIAPMIAPVLRARMKCLRPILSHAKAVIPPTQFVLDTYKEQGFSTENFHVIRHGINVPDIVPEPIEHEGFHILFIGSIAWQKGVHILVEAFNQMDENCRLSIAGGLDSFPEYAESLQELATHEGIEFLGRVPHEGIWELLASADCVVMPTLWYEASPLTIDEFFVTNTPIIASNIGAMTEKIRHGVDGLLFPVGDVRSLVDSLQLLQGDLALLDELRMNILPVRTVKTHFSELVSLYSQFLL